VRLRHWHEIFGAEEFPISADVQGEACATPRLPASMSWFFVVQSYCQSPSPESRTAFPHLQRQLV
jgi:hypothetical protein